MTTSCALGLCVFFVAVSIVECFKGSFFGGSGRHQPTNSGLFAKNWGPPSANPITGGYSPNSSPPQIDPSGGITYTVELTKRAGISWGSDLSFSWIYVLDLEQSGEASASGQIEKGDYIIAFGNDSTIGLDFDAVINTLQKQQYFSLNYTFFRGSKEQLMGRKMPEPSERVVTVTVVQAGLPDVILQCPGGTNIRELLVDNGINVYRSITRWTNCKGKQRCGTCIVDVLKNPEACTRKSLNENSALLENPESYRLSCITSVYEDVTLEVQGPVGEAALQRLSKP